MRRLARMDGLRGVLAVYIMLGHALPLTALPWWARAPFRHGEAAVDLFFALSGLVIANSLERFGGRFVPFMAARARRLLPVYVPVLLVSIWVTGLGDPLRGLPWVGAAGRDIVAAALPSRVLPHVAAHLLLLHGVIPQSVLPYAYVTLLGPAWSLSTEWQFYLLAGWLAPGRLKGFALALLAMGAVYRLLPLHSEFSRAFLPDAAPFFALGVASALFLRDADKRIFWVCLPGACLLGHSPVTPLIWGVVIWAQTGAWGAVLESRVLLYLGSVSYPLYLVNEPVQRALALGLGGLGPVGFTSLFLPLSAVLSLAAAHGLHRLVELPFLRLSWPRGGGKVAAGDGRLLPPM